MNDNQNSAVMTHSAAQEPHPAAKRTIVEITADLKARKATMQWHANKMLSEAIEIGRDLLEAKALLPHGQWGDYLKREAEFSQSTADNYMKLFEEYGAAQQSLFGAEANSQSLGNLSYTKALRLLALPAGEREEFVMEHDVDSMSTRELAAAIKERDEAWKQAARAESDAKAAEQARSKIEVDMQAANQRLEAAQLESGAAAQREAALREELEALKARPVEVAVENASEEQLEQARAEAKAEAEASLKKKLDQAEADAKSARDKLAEAQKEARTAEAALKEQLDQANERARTAETEAAQAKKELETTGNETLARFKIYFKDVQEQFNEMLACLRELAEAGDMEHHDKLVKAVRAVLNNWEGQV